MPGGLRGATLHRLAEVLGAHLHGSVDDFALDHLSIDSRRGAPTPGTLFIALRGERHDGHDHVAELARRGVRAFLVDHVPAHLAHTEGLALLVVPDTLRAFQRLVAHHRSAFRLPVVGITGSNGKTVVKEWLFHLLRGHERIVRSPGSWNSQVGVPLSVWELREGHSLALIECGISQPDEMDRLRPIVRPTIGVFTNIGPAHGENFPSDAAKALEKLKLFNDADALVYCADHAVVREAIARSAIGQRLHLRSWGRTEGAWLHVTFEQRVEHGTRITAARDGQDVVFDIPFTDSASVENALHCVTLLLHLGHTPAWIAERTPHLPTVAMRMEMVEGVHGITLINDAYSNDAASLAIALGQLERVAAGRPRTVVLSDILESGDAPEVLYHRVGAMLAHAGVGTVLTVGPALHAQRHHLPGAVHAFLTTEELLAGVDPSTIAGHALLVKGARAFHLERVVERWQRRMHGTVMEIDLGAIRHNLNHYRAMLGGGTRVMAMVKAFGYGTGAVELARLFAHERVDYLGVAYADEGVELRQQGIDLPILVMNPEPVPFMVLHRYGLEPEVYDARSFQEAAAYLATHGAGPAVHVKLDTGMRRLGFGPEELPALLDLMRSAPHVKVASVLSHFAAAEDPAQDAFTHAQLERFLNMARAMDEVLGYRPLRHMANSAAATRFPEARLDMVRLGIGLHGVGHDAAETMRLQHAVALRAPIAQLRSIQAGDTVGYGRRFRASDARTIATLPIGYADGLARRLGNGHGRLWLNGHPAPIVGHVCMDMCMVDVTGIPCAVGDLATVFDAIHPITELARDLGTIPYEVLTSVPPRVKRVYVGE
jgi:alanine racemase